MSAAAIWHRARWRWPALEGEIAKELDDYNKRPRKKFIGTSAVEYRFAQYFEEWRTKVERVGTLNYPEAARGKLYGSLVLTVTIRNDGSVAGIEINRSSGHKILDDAARRIVAMAAPFAAFPPAIRHDTDVLEITRTWNFTQRDSLETRAMKR
jgi:protein TonB